MQYVVVRCRCFYHSFGNLSEFQTFFFFLNYYCKGRSFFFFFFQCNKRAGACLVQIQSSGFYTMLYNYNDHNENCCICSGFSIPSRSKLKTERAQTFGEIQPLFVMFLGHHIVPRKLCYSVLLLLLLQLCLTKNVLLKGAWEKEA